MGKDLKKKGVLRETVEAVVIALILALFIRAFIVQAFKIPSGSMEPTLLIGDHLLVNKFIYGIHIPFTDIRLLPLRKPQRGDIIVFKFPKDRSKDYIKRVIAVEGDTVEIRNKRVYVNGQPLDEPYAYYSDDTILPGTVDPRDNFGPIKVPKDSFFVMGDNRDRSYDSRYWGFVNIKDVEGKAFIIYWSWDSNDHMVRFNRIGKIIR